MCCLFHHPFADLGSSYFSDLIFGHRRPKLSTLARPLLLVRFVRYVSSYCRSQFVSATRLPRRSCALLAAAGADPCCFFSSSSVLVQSPRARALHSFICIRVKARVFLFVSRRLHFPARFSLSTAACVSGALFWRPWIQFSQPPAVRLPSIPSAKIC